MLLSADETARRCKQSSNVTGNRQRTNSISPTQIYWLGLREDQNKKIVVQIK